MKKRKGKPQKFGGVWRVNTAFDSGIICLLKEWWPNGSLQWFDQVDAELKKSELTQLIPGESTFFDVVVVQFFLCFNDILASIFVRI